MLALAMLIGRESEVDALRREVDANPRVRVWGPSGVGKTRLVKEVFPNATFVDLTATRTRDEVLRALARAFELDDDSFVELKITRRRESDGLVVLDGVDGCDHALAPDWPGRWVLTARRAGDEAAQLEVRPLTREHAIALWQSRVDSSNTEIAAQIVERLDRLPLAIEWVAARATLLGEAGCLDRIERFRGDALADALDASLDACSSEEVRVLEAMAAFPRGVPVSALEQVGDLETIEALRRRSLVLRVGERARPYHAVTRRVNASLTEQRAREVRRLHARVVLAERPTRAGLHLLRDDLDAIASSDDDAALQATLAMLPLRMSDGELDIARERLASFDAPDAAIGLARLERRAGNFEAARAHATQARDARPLEAELELAHLDRQQSRIGEAHTRLTRLLENAHDERARCIAQGELGRLLQSTGRHREAREHHVEAIAACRTLGWAEREALERSLHARATHRGGDVREAIALHEHALRLHRELGDRRLAAAELGHLGFCHHEVGRHDDAERCFRESIEGLSAAGDVVLEHIERVLLARLLGDLNRFAEAHLELGIAAAIDRHIAMPRLEHTRLFVRGWIHLLEDRREDALADFERAQRLGVHVEVGFEALLEATLGAIREKPALVIDAENPALVDASRALARFAAGEAMDIDPELREISSDLRRVARLDGAEPLVIARDGSTLRWGDVHADLRRRNAPRRILGVLASSRAESPGVACTRDVLIEAGWPGEKMRADAADKRLRTAIWTLRKAGLEEVLLTRDEGYLLDPAVPVVLQ